MTIAATLRGRAKLIKRDVLTLWFAMRHPATPLAPKLLAAFTAAYALSPIDLIPDFIPVLGLLDDVILVPLMVAATVKLVPEAVLTECRAAAAASIAAREGKPTSWIGLGIVLFIWAVSAWLVWRVLA
ncbi:MAG: DUF1232 domain-containing protein [Betaproteobacteria bacterium]|nr:DUF1232 domain-containing protein [Betaproteobacteria bacterium]